MKTVDLIRLDQVFKSGILTKNEGGSITQQVPARKKVEPRGTLTKELIQQRFTLTLKINFWFGILYKTFTGKWKLKLYTLSDVLNMEKEPNGMVTFKRDGTFTGHYITHIDYEIFHADLTTHESQRAYHELRNF